MKREILEKEWNDQTPTCRTCGWANAFYEISGFIERLRSEDTESEECYWAPCGSKDDENPYTHKGYYLYVPKEESKK